MSHRGWGYRHLEHLDVHRTGNGGSQASARGPIPVAPVQHAQPFEVKSTPEKVAHTAYSAMAPSTHSTMFFPGPCTRAVALWCACVVARHCQSPQISPGEKSATFRKAETFTRTYPPPPLYPPCTPLQHARKRRAAVRPVPVPEGEVFSNGFDGQVRIQRGRWRRGDTSCLAPPLLLPCCTAPSCCCRTHFSAAAPAQTPPHLPQHTAHGPCIAPLLLPGHSSLKASGAHLFRAVSRQGQAMLPGMRHLCVPSPSPPPPPGPPPPSAPNA